MSLFIDDPDFKLYLGNVEDELRALPDRSVHCVVTSPPYYGLRDYGTAEWEGGDPACDHVHATEHQKQGSTSARAGRTNAEAQRNENFRNECGKCGATRVDQQVGLEETLDDYIDRMVSIFREVWRVLRDDGTVWLNLGDTFASNGGHTDTGGAHPGAFERRRDRRPAESGKPGHRSTTRARGAARIKTKDKYLVPHRVAIALQEPWYAGQITSEADRVWLAAMIDAEGCIYVHKRKAGAKTYSKFTKKDGTAVSYARKRDTYGAGLQIANVSREVIERIVEITGRGSVSTARRGKNQPLHKWCLLANEAKAVLREVYPHLVAKQQQARIAIGCPSSGDAAVAAHEALKGLHHGVSTLVDFPPPAALWEPGWYVRQDNVWFKRNGMPESADDRTTNVHEYVFHLAKRPRYFYDAEGVKEDATWERWGGQSSLKYTSKETGSKAEMVMRRTKAEIGEVFDTSKKNARSVWEINTVPYPDSHFAVFPPELPTKCIVAGSSSHGVCGDCGAPWEREMGRDCTECSGFVPRQAKECPRCRWRNTDWREERVENEATRAGESDTLGPLVARKTDLTPRVRWSGNWIPTCEHADARVVPATARVARSLGRHCVGVELSPEYAEQIARNTQQLGLLT